MIIKILKKALKEKILVGIYTNAEDTSKFTVGYVNMIFEEGVLVSIITPDVKNDGFVLLNMSMIYLVEYDNLYLKNIKKLIDIHKLKPNKLSFKRNKNKLLIVDFFDYCKKEKNCITIKHSYGFGISGYVLNVDDNYLSINTFTEEGVEDGITVIRIEEIEEIYLKGFNQEKIKMLST